ncbi:MAG: ATP-dependent DNA helicase RecG [Caldilineaceae bacterium]|nr:ATP-dependent DNA helicase RecG [Caldilineaceae bacterium]
MQRVLELEEKQGWRNRAVIGGLPAMSRRWADDAQGEGMPEQAVTAVLDLLEAYDRADEETRPDIAAALQAALEGDLDPAAELLQPQDEPDTDGPGENETAKENAPTSGNREADDDKFGDDEFGDDEFDDELDDDYVANLPPPEPTHIARRRVERRRNQADGETSTADDLAVSPSVLKGVGDARSEQLERLGINTINDLVRHLPYRYDDYSQLRTISDVKPGEQVTIVANLWEVRTRKLSRSREMVQGILADGTGTLHATWWNKWIVKQLEPGKTLRFSGKIGLYLGQKTIENPVFEEIDEEMVATGRLSPIYRLTEGVKNGWLHDLIIQALERYGDGLVDPLPPALRDEYDLPDLQTALEQVHLPDGQEEMEAAFRRLAFEELFYVQLGVLQRRQTLKESTAPAMTIGEDLLAAYTAGLPFPLTGAQGRVLDEVARDLRRGTPMARLIQGDVGSGKTAVAAGAIYAAGANGLQSALLAPTQILAEQHYRGISGLLADLTRPDGAPLTIALLTGRVTGAARDEVLAGLADGSIDLVVGTTALIQEGVEFAHLGFVIVDEQHRFGVEQRGALRTKSDLQPHVLVMSATPIPRSLALTIYGDLDVSIIDEMPPGRTPVKTKIFSPVERERLYSFMRREAREGRQAYIVYPLVEESDKLDAGAAVEAYDQLSRVIFPELSLGLLHGRMTGSEKDAVMQRFAAGEHDVLVSTTVIEVGIDVPNASLILIEDAERFGLAQLHQLRGRVGRGGHKSYCALISKDGESERLTALAETNDGFALAEKDLVLRGPGDFLGTRQSGLPDLRVARLTDVETVAQAREAAQSYFAYDPTLQGNHLLAEQVQRFWRGEGDIS